MLPCQYYPQLLSVWVVGQVGGTGPVSSTCEMDEDGGYTPSLRLESRGAHSLVELHWGHILGILSIAESI